MSSSDTVGGLMMGEWMIDHRAWLVPLLGIPAGVFLLWLVAARVSSRRKERTGLSQFPRDRVPRSASEDEPVLESPFLEPPRVEIAGKDATPVLWAVLHPETVGRHEALLAMHRMVLEAMVRHQVSRVALALERAFPSSRLFWHGMRLLGEECSRAGGVLVVREPRLSLDVNRGGERNEWYAVAPAGTTDEDCRAMAARLEAWPSVPAPPPD